MMPSNRKILIVEDEFLIRETLAEALADDGFDVVQAGSADDALAVIAGQMGIALLLTDLQLPGSMDGMQLARTLRRSMPELAVIFVSGRPDRLAKLGMSPRDAIIAKPYRPSEICAAARRLTGG
jgi:DNA-binding response OmpR family regulator